jgi:GMP synthase (glutamine-hydrolysing)
LIALNLGLGERFAYRQPFPGPGLYCRMVGLRDFTPDQDFQTLEARVVQAGNKFRLNAHVLPIKTVGVQGDVRSYKHPVAVSGEVDWDVFERFSSTISNELREVNRVFYVFGEPLTTEQSHQVTRTLMTHDVIRQTQECDFIMRQIAERYGFNDSRKCSQKPGSLIPLGFGKDGKRSFVVRPAYTGDFMGIIGMRPYRGSSPPIENSEEYVPEDMLLEIAEEIPKKVEGISRVSYDGSNKPPASTELE